MSPAGAGLGSHLIRDYIFLATSEADPVIDRCLLILLMISKLQSHLIKAVFNCLNREWNLVVLLVMVSGKYVCRLLVCGELKLWSIFRGGLVLVSIWDSS